MITFLPEDRNDVPERRRASSAGAGVIQHLVERGPARFVNQAAQEMLLQQLVSRCRPLPEHRVDFLRDILHLHARQERHAGAIDASMHAIEEAGRRPVVGARTPDGPCQSGAFRRGEGRACDRR